MAGDDAWPPSNVTRSALEARVKAGILRPLTDVELPEWIVPSANDREPNPPPGYVVCFLLFLDRGFGTPASCLIRAILHYYEVELHNLIPNSVMQAAVFATVCEGFLGVPPHWNLWLHLFKADMAAHYEGGDKFPLRVGGCTLQLRQQRSNQYIWSAMPSSNRGWQSGWFYIRNDGGLLPEYTGKMVTECPQKWVWGAPAEEQKRLAPLLARLEKLRDARVTAATVATAFHKRSLLPLAQRRAFMFEMTQDVPWVGTRMLEEPVSASDIAARVSKTTHPDLKNSRVVPMRPKKGYISLVRCSFLFLI
jgi:hypothetical protein